MDEINDKKWILYITIPLILIVLMICIVCVIEMYHPFTIGFTMDNNTLEAVRLMNYTGR